MFEQALAAFDESVAGTAPAAAPATGLERGRDEERRGDWRTVLGQVEPEQLASFTVMVPEAARAERGDLRLEFSRSHGVVLLAGPGNAGEIERAVPPLSAAIAPGVPRWSWLLSEVAEVIAAVLIGVFVELAWLGLSHHFDNPDVLDFLPLPIGILAGFGVLTLLRPLLPRFRVASR
jgi:hypothetical protein